MSKKDIQKKSVQYISREELCSRFNETIYPKKLEGKFSETILRENDILHSVDKSDCKKTQLVKYETNKGVEVARVHQYLLEDGSLGASGLPDPKRICQKGIVYACDPPKK